MLPTEDELDVVPWHHESGDVVHVRQGDSFRQRDVEVLQECGDADQEGGLHDAVSQAGPLPGAEGDEVIGFRHRPAAAQEPARTN